MLSFYWSILANGFTYKAVVSCCTPSSFLIGAAQLLAVCVEQKGRDDEDVATRVGKNHKRRNDKEDARLIRLLVKNE